MRTQDVLDAEGTRQWFLDAPESRVLSAGRERELLLELSECRRGLLRATRRPDGSEWDPSRPDAESRRAVRGWTDGPSAHAAPELVRRYEEVRTALALANARLVAYIARRYLNRGVAPSDLLQEGFCGLLEAIDRFDPTNTTRLATYASWWIRQAIQRAIADGGYPVRLTPRQLRRLAQALSRPDATAGADASPSPTGPSPRVDRPATPGRAPAAWYELAAIRPRVSLDAVSRGDHSTPLAELLAFIPEAEPDADEPADALDDLLAALGPREQLVLRLRFGLDGHARHSLSQIGALLDVSKERVRQIQERALRKLRAAAEPAGLGRSRSVD